ncbi:hypothetical protein GCM10011348_26800 [Marinobacterium nitratireducens]|uniref:Uncharacterized protein n=1 Tax=Marinobacterium nitratireducens TaxID=518897 RepID=A0A917ZIC0_9GAMM|nr:hypothetical protein GCM10011348_26800 [Marinobacterium nitratireducens]
MPSEWENRQSELGSFVYRADGSVVLRIEGRDVDLEELSSPEEIGSGKVVTLNSLGLIAIKGSPIVEVRGTSGRIPFCYVVHVFKDQPSKFMGGCPKERYRHVPH